MILFVIQPALTLVFVETKRGADALENWLCMNGFPAIAIHGDKVQMVRLSSFFFSISSFFLTVFLKLFWECTICCMFTDFCLHLLLVRFII